MFNNVGFAESIVFSDIKIGEKVSKYFNDQEISQYYMSDSKNNPAGVIIYDKDKRYSYLLFVKKMEFLMEILLLMLIKYIMKIEQTRLLGLQILLM